MPYNIINKYNYTTEMEVQTLPTGRTYFTPAGNFSSITTILGKTANNVWLQRWKDRVGEEEAARVSKEATDRGTLIHEYAEHHFNNELIDYSSETPVVRQMTRDLIKTIDSGIEEIYGQEQILWSNKYKYAGRTDMVGIWKGTLSIIDFKTSKKKKSERQITDYFLQCCAYAVAHNEMYGTGIRHGVIAITVENGEPQLFEKDISKFIYKLRDRLTTFEKIKNNH